LALNKTTLNLLLGSAIFFFMPETLGKPIPDTMDDMQALYDDIKPWYAWLPRKDLRALQKKAREEKKRRGSVFTVNL